MSMLYCFISEQNPLRFRNFPVYPSTDMYNVVNKKVMEGYRVDITVVIVLGTHSDFFVKY